MSFYITCFFLVFAGMLIGYFLWYRDRSEEEELRISLSRDNEDMRTSLKLAHNSHQQLDERFTRQKGQLNVLQQLCDDWSTSREQAERDRAQLEVEVADKNRRYEEVLADLQAEKQKRISLEDETHTLTQLQITKLSSLEGEWRERHAKIESSLFQRQADLKSTASEKSRLAKQLHESEARLAELQADLATQRSQLEIATKNASGLEQEYVSVESSLQESSELLKASRAECASTMSAQKVAEESLAELQDKYESAQQQIEALQAKVSNMDSLESQVISLQEACANSREQLEKVSLQRDETLEAEKKTIGRATGLQKRIDNQEATIHALRAKHDDALENLKLELNKRAEVEMSFESKSVELQNQLTAQTASLQQQTGDLSSKFKKERGELQAQIDAKTKSIEELQAKRKTELSEVAQLQAKITQQTETIESLSTKHKSDRSGFQQQLTGHILSIEQLNAERIKDQTESKNRLTAHTSKLQSMQQLMEQRELEQAELQQQIASQTKALELATCGRQELETELQQKIVSQSQTIEQLTASGEQFELELVETKSQLTETNSNLESARRRASELTLKVEELKTTCQRISELEKLVQRRDQEDEKVVAELRELREQYAESFSKQQELQSELDRVSVRWKEVEIETANYDHQLELLRMKLKASEETIRTLRRERAAVLARLANYRTIAEPDATVISFTEAMQRRQKDATYYDQEYGGHTSQHAVRGLVYTEAPDTKDDLKLISGIAEVLEARLNDYGIYTFKQIKEWKPEAIEEFSRLLAFRDRIQRDEWLAQASRFYDQKQRTYAA